MLLSTGVSWRYKKFKSKRQTDSIEKSSMYHLGLLALPKTMYTTLYIQDSAGCADYESLFTERSE